jgi:hypothetical protein
MASTETTKSTLPTFLGGIGAILIFALVIYIAYLPNRPAPIDAAANEARQIKADEARAAGRAKIENYSVAADGSVIIPVERAMELVVTQYRN